MLKLPIKLTVIVFVKTSNLWAPCLPTVFSAGAMPAQLTLDDNSDTDEEEEYQPTEQEIIDYAKFLGMVLPEDHDLLYIAEEGVS